MKPAGELARSRAERLVESIDRSEALLDKAARVLHDDVGQILSAAGLQLDVLRLDMQDKAPEIAPRTAEIQKMLEDAMVRIRELSRELNPPVVERAGLQPALERLVRRVQENFPGAIALKFDTAVHAPREAARKLFKVAECALDNAVAHSGAKRIEVRVGNKSQDVVLEVRDNGSGFDLREARERAAGIGLLVMQCNASSGGIGLAVDTAPGKGTIIRATFTPPE
ncbi:MAG: histidine kinase [Bryobacteraceae bacterium]